MKIGKRAQTKIDKELITFFGWLSKSGNGEMLYDGFQRYIAKRNMQVILNEEKEK
jgi:hypothetical protein